MPLKVGSKVLIQDTSADCPSGRGVVMEVNANKTECLVLYDDGYEATRGWFSVDLLDGVKETEPPHPLPERGPRTQGDALRRINAVLAAALVDIDDYLAHPQLVGNLRAIPEVRGGVADALETVRWLQRVDSWQEKKV